MTSFASREGIPSEPRAEQRTRQPSSVLDSSTHHTSADGQHLAKSPDRDPIEETPGASPFRFRQTVHAY